ncbi:hypothetical protein PtrM4_107720 [Pyrenophora tritici-repentis]|uniref:DJ-1/PfpI domain-containing protein n=1 Tax=Pyrenophora tritici-repentis TaxID=45151 RepID=A0A834RVN1_9PLEO|nr:hypothetical protein PtrM4_107720 [Pyrenophora tritici-repentis]
MRYSSLFPTLLAFQPSLCAPSQPPITNTSTLPTHYGLLIFPHYQALDIFGPMDLLNSLFMLYSNMTQTPHLSVLSKTMAPVTSAMMTGGFGQEIVPTTTFADYLTGREKDQEGDSTSKGDIDVLVVPGGGGTRRDMSAEIDFVKLTYPKVGRKL